MKLWRYNPITGYWRMERVCGPDTAQQWLIQFSKDEPDARFALSRFAPRVNPTKQPVTVRTFQS